MDAVAVVVARDGGEKRSRLKPLLQGQRGGLNARARLHRCDLLLRPMLND
jgi:hypothetical protein